METLVIDHVSVCPFVQSKYTPSEHTGQSVLYRSNVQMFIRSLPFKSVQWTTKRTTAKPLLSNTLNAFERIKFAVHLPFNRPGRGQTDKRIYANASERIEIAVQICRSSVHRSVSRIVPQLRPHCETFHKKSDLKIGNYSEIASEIFSIFTRIGLETRRAAQQFFRRETDAFKRPEHAET